MKLEEFVTKLQQENEDYKARMDKHAELSRYTLGYMLCYTHVDYTNVRD